MVIIGATVGAYVQSYYSYENPAGAPDPQEQVKTMVTVVQDSWGNTNGGFGIQDIQTAQKDDECPSYQDQIINLTCTDFGGYVVFSYFNGIEYDNILFYKSAKGLILDGVMNTNSRMSGGLLAVFNEKLDSFKWAYNKDELNDKFAMRESPPEYWMMRPGFHFPVDDLVSVSRQTNAFHNRVCITCFNGPAVKERDLKEAVLLAGRNATDNFIKFGEVELIGDASDGFRAINSFYNYLYNQLKGEPYNVVRMIDGTNNCCVPIPKNEQTDYPISEDKKSEYNNQEYYGVYKCDIGFYMVYREGNCALDVTTNNEDYIARINENEETKDLIEVEVYEPNVVYSKLHVGFVNKPDSIMPSDEILSSAPIEITFTNERMGITKEVVIDSMLDLFMGVDILLRQGNGWAYNITSSKVSFDNFNGRFEADAASCRLTFEFAYFNECVILEVGLNPIGNIDLSKLDLRKTPVRIVFSNEKNLYEFIFASNDVLLTRLPRLMELGTYNYTILSDALLFASNSGTIDITPSSTIQLFNCALGSTASVDCRLTSSYDESLESDVEFRVHDNVVDAFYKNHLENTECEGFDIDVVVYDADGTIVFVSQRVNIHIGEDINTLDLTMRFKCDSTRLSIGEHYILQVRCLSDSGTIYLSSAVDFDHTDTVNVYNILPMLNISY